MYQPIVEAVFEVVERFPVQLALGKGGSDGVAGNRAGSGIVSR
jgi:hypothetical protein